MDDNALAARLDRIAEWQVGLRPGERADLRAAAEIVRQSDSADLTAAMGPLTPAATQLATE